MLAAFPGTSSDSSNWKLSTVGIVHITVAIDVHSSYGTAVMGDARNSRFAGIALLRLEEELKYYGVDRLERELTRIPLHPSAIRRPTTEPGLSPRSFRSAPLSRRIPEAAE